MNWAWTVAGGWLLPGVLGGGSLLLLTCILARRTAGPVRRQRLGEWGVAAALLAAALSFGPRWLDLSPSFPHLPPPARPVSAPDTTGDRESADPVDPAPPFPTEASGDTDGGPGFVPAPEVETPAAPPVAEESAPPTVPSSAALWQDGVWSLVGWLGAAHAVGAVVLLGRWLLGHVGLWRLLRSAEPVPAEVAAVCRSLAGGGAVPRLLQARRLRVPLSCGLLRPTILLPASFCGNPNAPALSWVLAHELTHLARRDVWGCLLFGVGEIVFYALPWFWWLRRQAALCREYLADAAAAAQGGTAEDYAQFLLSLTAAPAAPAGATGVTGHTSDLFRRVAMLLQAPRPVEKRPPRLWSLGVAAGLLSLAALVAGVGFRADAAARADEPAKKEQPKKDDTKTEKPSKEAEKRSLRFQEILKSLPPEAEFTPEQLKQLERLVEEVRKRSEGGLNKEAIDRLDRQVEELSRTFGGGQVPPGANPLGGGFRGAGQEFAFGPQPPEGRLGVVVKEPSPALADQLDLPKGQGVVIEQVVPDSPAAKAGLKANDILLELNGKSVSSHAAEVVKAINDLKAKTPVDAVVMRKGKKETIKGISLPAATKTERPGFPGGGGFGGGAGGFPGGGGGFGGFGGAAGGFAGGPANGVITTVFRAGDRFTARHQEGNLVISVTGTVADGKATTKGITVQDGGKRDSYEGVDKVPEQYRDKVKNLVEMGEKGAVKVEIK